MTEKTKERLIFGSLAAVALLILYLLLRSNGAGSAVNPAGTVTLGGSSTTGPGGVTLGGSPYTLSLPGANVGPSTVNLGTGDSGGGCCNTCGCDQNSINSTFAASVGAALNGYSQALGLSEANYQTALFGQIPDFVSQYVAIADPTAPGSLNG